MLLIEKRVRVSAMVVGMPRMAVVMRLGAED
jgi:hypothetical protein